MTLAEYVRAIKKLPVYGDRESVVRLMDFAGPAIFNILLGLPEEVGELFGKVKRVLRDEGGGISDAARKQLELEAGDIVWQLFQVLLRVGIDPAEALAANIKKLSSRAKRGKLKGSGDDR